ncbi:ankyrin repeat, SAM and basic leucine zipper domain-containing protein 1 isoform X2 [Stigmatopora argus]
MDESKIGGFPAGYESDSSNEDWYTERPPEKKIVHFQNPDNEEAEEVDNVFLMKNAISEGNVRAIERLLDKGMDVESNLGFDWTPLIFALILADDKVAQVLLDRGANANFSKDNKTMLMVACTALAEENQIARCVALLLSRNADPNVTDRFQVTCLMLAARDNHCKVINLLASHGADLNMQQANGYTALSMAVLHGREEAALKLLQLGADRTIETKEGKSPAQLALLHKRTEIYRILSSSTSIDPALPLAECFSAVDNADARPASFVESVPKTELELFLHGLDLEYLTDIINKKDITWSHLLTMKEEELVKIGITEPEDQQKVLSAGQKIQLDRVDLDTIERLGVTDSGSEELLNYLIKLKQQCCCLTESMQDVIRHFPLQVSKLVFTLDHKRKAESVCDELMAHTQDLQTEVNCLHRLLCQMNDTPNFCGLPVAPGDRKAAPLAGVAAVALGAALFFFLCRR